LNAIQALSQLSYAPLYRSASFFLTPLPNIDNRSSYEATEGDRQEPPSIAEGIGSVNELGLAKIAWAGILQRSS
jgi:hypothetical protein